MSNLATAKELPPNYASVTPHLVVGGASDAIAFYTKAFGAEEIMRLKGPDGSVVHADVKVGSTVIWLADENLAMGLKSPKTLGGSATSQCLFVRNVDEAVERAEKAGATVTMPPSDMFWGARFARVTDPFGHQWSFASPKSTVTPQEMQAAIDKMAAKPQ